MSGCIKSGLLLNAQVQYITYRRIVCLNSSSDDSDGDADEPMFARTLCVPDPLWKDGDTLITRENCPIEWSDSVFICL